MNRIEQFANVRRFIVQTDNSVRIFTKRDLKGFKPERGSQVFVGRLPADAYEDEIFNFFSQIGLIFQIKLILKMSGETKGYAFVTFVDAELAYTAVADLNGKHIRPNHPVFVGISTDHRSLVLKGVEAGIVSTHQIKQVFHRIAKTEVEVLRPSCFRIEFPEHHLAYRALKEFALEAENLWGESAVLEWENNLQANLTTYRINEQSRLKWGQSANQERIKEIAKELAQLQLVQEHQRAKAGEERQTNQSPDSGVGSCGRSVGTLSPTGEASGAQSPSFSLAASAKNLAAQYIPSGPQPIRVERSTLLSVYDAAASNQHRLAPQYIHPEKQAFNHSKFSTPYCTASVGAKDTPVFNNALFDQKYCWMPDLEGTSTARQSSSTWDVVDSVVSWVLDDNKPVQPGVGSTIGHVNCSCRCQDVHFMKPKEGAKDTPVFNNALLKSCWMPDLEG